MHSARRTLVSVLILFGQYLVFTNNQVRADRASCEQIKTACKNAGFVLGGGCGLCARLNRDMQGKCLYPGDDHVRLPASPDFPMPSGVLSQKA
ncbi:MAG: hypothetical protein WA002_10035 [Candidatus Acidiferrales bacterium]